VTLGEKRRGSSDDTGGAGQFTGHDATAIHRRLECATTDLDTQWFEKRITGLSHAAGDDDDVRIEHVEQVRNAGSEVTRGVTNNFARNRIAM
jgi:hypothetical protein